MLCAGSVTRGYECSVRCLSLSQVNTILSAAICTLPLDNPWALANDNTKTPVPALYVAPLGVKLVPPCVTELLAALTNVCA